MAIDGNGWPVEAVQKALNGPALVPRSKSPTKQKRFSIFSIISRLLTWYLITTILFRCPSTLDQVTDSSPKICKPYFHLRTAATPHLEPYYNAYAAPYIDAARPYYDTLDRRIITPAAALGKKYGAPRIAQAQAFGQAQWEKTFQPQVLKYKGIVKGKYDETLAPHLDKAIAVAGPYYDIARTNALQTFYGHILPTYTAVQPYALQVYGIANDFVINTAIPYSKWAWTTTGNFLSRTVFPKLRILYGENVEPQLVRIGERLGRYRDGKKVMAAVHEIDSSSSAFSASQTFLPRSSSISSTHSTTSVSSSSVKTSVTSSEAPASTPLSEKEIREKAQTVVANDLKIWQEKFAKAADEGSEELNERIAELTDRLIKNQAEKVGTALNIQLEETVKSSLKTLKSSIISIVEACKDNEEFEESEESLSTAVRKAGFAIKEKAQAVRTWKQNYDKETNSLVSKAAEDTFQILDHIRDLGLQEIGMRWAWTDGITHKDWTKYHKLKPKFDEWHHEVELVAVNHPGLVKARSASEEVENKAMDTAEWAANELASLKETGRWKISTGDSGDDWTTKIMPAAAVVAKQKVLDKISEASEVLFGASTSQDTMESMASVASSSGSSIASSATSISSDVTGTPQGNAESVIPVESASASTLSDEASSSIIGTQQGNTESISSVAKEFVSSIVDQASSSVIGTPQGSVESMASVFSESASSLSVHPSSATIGTGPNIVESASSSAESVDSILLDSASSLSDASSSVVSQASKSATKGSSSVSWIPSSASISTSADDVSSSIRSSVSTAASTDLKKVWGGAMAQSVKAKQIVYEDFTASKSAYMGTSGFLSAAAQEKLSEALSLAAADFADATSRLKAVPTNLATKERILAQMQDEYNSGVEMIQALYSEFLGTVSSVMMPIPTRTEAREYAKSASSMASSVFTPPPSLETILDNASSRLNDAVEAASIQLYGSKTGYAEAARSSMSNAVSSVEKAISEAIYGTSTGTYKSAANAAGDAYASGAKGAMESAQSRLTAAVESARVKMAEFAATAGEDASEAARKASEGVEEFASSVCNAVDSATSLVKVEL